MMFFGWILALLGLGGLAYQLGWRPSERSDARGGGKSALDILKERYARGEITKEQYDQMRRDIED